MLRQQITSAINPLLKLSSFGHAAAATLLLFSHKFFQSVKLIT